MKIVENTLAAGLMALEGAVPEAMGTALYEFAEGDLLPLAKERTPVDYGILRDSGLVKLPKITKDGVTVEIGFGGGAAHYALWVHEDLEAKHEVGQAKFLESAINDLAGSFLPTVAANLARVLGTG